MLMRKILLSSSLLMSLQSSNNLLGGMDDDSIICNPTVRGIAKIAFVLSTVTAITTIALRDSVPNAVKITSGTLAFILFLAIGGTHEDCGNND